MKTTDDIKLPPMIYADKWGFDVRVKIGSGKNASEARKRFDKDAHVAAMVAWQTRERARLQEQRDKDAATRPAIGTLEASVDDYMADADLSKGNAIRRRQQLRWWCAQPAAQHASTVSVEQLAADPMLATHPGRLGLVPRAKLDPKRLRQILADAFAPTDEDADPTEFAGTSNHYRMALFHLFTVLDQDVVGAPNPVRNVKLRATKEAEPSGVDMRIVREILTHVPSRFGKSGRVTELRINVLAWVHITPIQLQRLNPTRDFHDVPDATRADILDGAITLTVPVRYKGRQKKIKAPQTIPLTPWGVDAVRALVAEPAAWTHGGHFSLPPVNQVIKRAAARAQAALAAKGVGVDLSGFTLYHLKHSLLSAAQMASPGLFDRQGRIQVDPGVQAVAGHAKARTTGIYTQSAVAPLLVHANVQTTRFLDALFRQPLRPSSSSLRLVANE